MGNPFLGRSDKSYKTKRQHFEKVVICTYKLVDKAKVINKDKGEAVIITEPVLVDSYNLTDTIQENAKNCISIEETYKRVLMGDSTVLSTPVYADMSKVSSEKIEALDYHSRVESFVKNLSEKDLKTLKEIYKLSDKELLDLINKNKKVADVTKPVEEHKPAPSVSSSGSVAEKGI